MARGREAAWAAINPAPRERGRGGRSGGGAGRALLRVAGVRDLCASVCVCVGVHYACTRVRQPGALRQQRPGAANCAYMPGCCAAACGLRRHQLTSLPSDCISRRAVGCWSGTGAAGAAAAAGRSRCWAGAVDEGRAGVCVCGWAVIKARFTPFLSAAALVSNSCSTASGSYSGAWPFCAGGGREKGVRGSTRECSGAGAGGVCKPAVHAAGSTVTGTAPSTDSNTGAHLSSDGKGCVGAWDRQDVPLCSTDGVASAQAQQHTWQRGLGLSTRCAVVAGGPACRPSHSTCTHARPHHSCTPTHPPAILSLNSAALRTLAATSHVRV